MLATVRLFPKLLFGLTAHDTVTMLCAIGILTAVTLLAGYLLPRRMRVEPMVVLRYE